MLFPHFCGLGHAPLAGGGNWAGLTLLCGGEGRGDEREQRADGDGAGNLTFVVGRMSQEALIEKSIICPEDFLLR